MAKHQQGNGWTNTADTALQRARELFKDMQLDDVILLDRAIPHGEQWEIDVKHTVSGKKVPYRLHGLDNPPAYAKERGKIPQDTWNGRPITSKDYYKLSDFAAPGCRETHTFRRGK